jgi:hypothetical protein
MKIALCLQGLVGSIKGKNCQMIGGGDKVLEISYKHNKKHLLDLNKVDTFIHSWSTELKDDMIKKYNPKSYIIEPQIEFKIPPYIKSDSSRAFAHLSRWYSYKKVVELVNEYELLNKFEYDLILVQRFDLIWNVDINFKNIDPFYFYVGKSSLNPSQEWSDRWFLSNSSNMKSFSLLYDNISKYMGKNGDLPSNSQYAGISSHFLTRHHAKKQNLKEKFMFNFGGYGSTPNDYNEVRKQYYND